MFPGSRVHLELGVPKGIFFTHLINFALLENFK